MEKNLKLKHMELFILLPFMFLFGIMLSKRCNSEDKSKSSITRIDDKNWIVNNELVSFEEDTPLLRMQQETEDRKHYNSYVKQKMSWDREDILDGYMSFMDFEHKHPEDLPVISDIELSELSNEYDQYDRMCNRLDTGSMRLNKKEFLQKKKCKSCLIFPIPKFRLLRPQYGYTIFNEKNAKYINGDMSELIRAEFKKEWY